MSNLNKRFVCASCQTPIVLTSEGDSFTCPKCQVNNVIPKKNNPLMNLIAVSYYYREFLPNWWAFKESVRHELVTVRGQTELAEALDDLL